MKPRSKFRFLIFLFLFTAIIFCFYFLSSGSDPEGPAASKTHLSEQEPFSFAEMSTGSIHLEETSDLDPDKNSNDSFILVELVGFPFLSKTKEIFENLGENIFRPDPDLTEKAKVFQEKLEYLDNKRSFTGLNTFEEEEYILLQLRKKKDLREILNITFEKLKEELSETRRKEFQTELESLDLSISELSKKIGNH
ncbi:hypothetical protein AB3N61_02825 [Leptospira sp. WS58.C1]|uniref:hypothetical protein n=1 Tax=Leptospira TaxID=171 RepID=UPI0002BF6E85|nr:MULTISPECIES: hypothetical protein [unclassified Leptospira]EMK01394.1 hypothetical protein LEP1GSC192_2664 [Leptospira sp. B5-022]MCR1794459.1 hypothetical protein [Leptospira sp. id769339]